jgi:hypothetical protein
VKDVKSAKVQNAEFCTLADANAKSKKGKKLKMNAKNKNAMLPNAQK